MQSYYKLILFLLYLPIYSQASHCPNGISCLAWLKPTFNIIGEPLTNLAGYKVYYGLTSRNYTDNRTINNPLLTEAEIPAPVVTEDTQFFIAMTAFDSNGNESAYSNEIIYLVHPGQQTINIPGVGIINNILCTSINNIRCNNL